MKRYSRAVKVEGKLFVYDREKSLVLYVGKIDNKNRKWFEDEETIDDKYFVVDRAGLSKDNWANKEARHDYLAEWAFELDCELSNYDLSEFI